MQGEMHNMSKDNGKIILDAKTKEQINMRRLKIQQLQNDISLILNTVLNVKDKTGDYKPNREFTALELIKKDKEG